MPENTDKTEESAVPIPVSKHSFRKKVWEHLEKNNLVNFPRPVKGRIPNFKGCEEAAERLSQLDVFINAQNIKVNPDKPQEPARFVVLEHKKNLFVPIPRLASGLLKHILLPENANKEDIKKAVSRKGIDINGKDVGIDDIIKIDLVVLGSVAVSKEGYRIGKGKGYADLEFGILSHMKAVNSNTLVVTTVHDSQVFNTLPPELFGPHDVPVDIIITPTEVIIVEKLLPKPQGIIWNLLSQRRVDLMPILKALREIDEKDGKDVSLKEIDSDIENYSPEKRRPFRRFRRYRYSGGRRTRSEGGGASEEATNGEKGERERGEKGDRERGVRERGKRRISRRRPQRDSSENGNAHTDGELNSPQHNKRRPKRNFRKNKPMIDFSLMVKNIEKNVRIRDLKAALAERGIKPNVITWRGFRGYCCLHFSKTNPNTISDPDQNSHGVDNVIGMLQNLKINPDSKTQLSIEIMKPISRIETTDVTSV